MNIQDEKKQSGTITGGFWWRLVFALCCLSLLVTLPVLPAGLRELIRSLSPDLLGRWIRVAWESWVVVVGLSLAPTVWARREKIGIVAWRVFVWLGRQIWRLVCSLWSGGANRRMPPSRDIVATPPVEVTQHDGYYPPLSLLGGPVEISIRPCPEVGKEVNASIVALGIQGCKVLRAFEGPVVQVVDVRPPDDLPVRKLRSLQEDLALRLGAQSVTVTPAGTPGVLQLQITTTKRTAAVPLRVLIDSEAYRAVEELPLVVAVDPAGRPLIADLAHLPHLLIGGATRSGKTYLLRAIIMGLIYSRAPSDMRLVMVDPKQVELAMFEGLPHLLRPVITSPGEASMALQSLVGEMERRYGIFQSAKVVNIQSYNSRVPRAKRLPYLVVVIDELADLMQSQEKGGIESSIQRLGQKARAAGIHLVVATQRPSVDVVTGIIKANLPARIGLRVASLHDSRTILDLSAAEGLRGAGDLFFKPEDILLRGQAPIVPDELLVKVVGWWRQPQYAVPEENRATAVVPDEVPPEPSRDEQDLRRAQQYALTHGVISRRIIERELSIKTVRAANILKTIEEAGWLAPSRGGPHPRQVVFTPQDRRRQLSELLGVPVENVRLSDDANSAAEAQPEAVDDRDGDSTPDDDAGDEDQDGDLADELDEDSDEEPEDEPDDGDNRITAYLCTQCGFLGLPEGSVVYECMCGAKFERNRSGTNRCPHCGRFAATLLPETCRQCGGEVKAVRVLECTCGRLYRTESEVRACTHEPTPPPLQQILQPTPATDFAAQDQRLARAAERAIAARDWDALTRVARELGQLIDQALDQDNADGFNQLAATSRWIQAWLPRQHI